MSALRDVQVLAEGQTTASGLAITPALWAELSPFIAKFFWSWYDSHKDTILLRAGFWFIHFTVRVQDLDNLFTDLFGPEPTASSVLPGMSNTL